MKNINKLIITLSLLLPFIPLFINNVSTTSENYKVLGWPIKFICYRDSNFPDHSLFLFTPSYFIKTQFKMDVYFFDVILFLCLFFLIKKVFIFVKSRKDK